MIRPSEALKLHRHEITKIVESHDALNPRIFGSTVRGEDTIDSDLDILVDPISGKTTLISLINIEDELTSLLGVKVDVQTPMSLSDRFRDNVLSEAVPV